MLDRRGGLVKKNYYRRGGVVSRNRYRKNISRLGFQEGGYAHMPGYSSNPDIIHYLKLLKNEIKNYDFSDEADSYHGWFLGNWKGTGKTRNDMLDYVAKQTGKTEAEVIKEDPSWTEPIEDWTKKLLAGQVDDRISEIQENPTNQGIVDEAVKKLFSKGTILNFPQKLQDTILNRVGAGYRQQFGVPIDTKMLENALGTTGNELKKQIQEIKTAGTNYTSAEDVGEQDRQSPWSTIADKGLSLLGFGGAYAGEPDVGKAYEPDVGKAYKPDDVDMEQFRTDYEEEIKKGITHANLAEGIDTMIGLVANYDDYNYFTKKVKQPLLDELAKVLDKDLSPENISLS
jgi:hypothetical protein